MLGSPFVDEHDQLRDFRIHRVAPSDKLRHFRECLVSLIHLDGSILSDACLERLAGRYSLVEVMCHPVPRGEHRPEYVALQRDRFAGSELVSYAELASAGSRRNAQTPA